MNSATQQDDFDDRPAGKDLSLIVDVAGFEGPLDLLLELARRQKVDILRISILELAEQYLGFVEVARQHRLELAADYLVMAAWLAYLKSRLLLPKAKVADEPSAEDLATSLAERLQRLEAMRRLGALLGRRHAEAGDTARRGAPEAPEGTVKISYVASVYDLLSAYADSRRKPRPVGMVIEPRFVWSLADARIRLERLVGAVTDWAALEPFLALHAGDAGQRRSLTASSFACLLELVREGHVELRQTGSFEPLLLRRRPAAPAVV